MIKGSVEAKEWGKKMIERRQKGGEIKEVASYQAREDLKERKRLLEVQLEQSKNPRFDAEKRLDGQSIRAQINEVEAQIKRVEPPVLSGRQKDVLYTQGKTLEAEIKEGMPTRDEMMGEAVMIRGNPVGGRQANPDIVRKNMAWLEKNEEKIREWKNIQRQLDPNDPNISNVERLRRIS